jgi:D-glycero-D-manno-heptose 1,7-bisphosphate phosphatase
VDKNKPVCYNNLINCISKSWSEDMSKCTGTVFLDRDGVINVKAAEGHYITKWSDFRFLPGAITAIKLLKDKGFQIIIITNQRGIAKGLMTESDVKAIHAEMQAVLRRNGTGIDGIYICPHEKGTCHCRKPEIGLFLRAEKNFTIDKQASWMVGDSLSDILAGQNYGIRTIAIGACQYGADYLCSDLYGAAQIIIRD